MVIIITKLVDKATVILSSLIFFTNKALLQRRDSFIQLLFFWKHDTPLILWRYWIPCIMLFLQLNKLANPYIDHWLALVGLLVNWREYCFGSKKIVFFWKPIPPPPPPWELWLKPRKIDRSIRRLFSPLQQFLWKIVETSGALRAAQQLKVLSLLWGLI